MKTYTHKSVMTAEVIEALAIQPNGIYIDATFGRGGHSFEILKLLGTEGRLLAMDRDPEAIATAQNAPFSEDTRFQIVRGPFSEIKKVTADAGLTGQVNGVLMDIGVSSPQLEDPQRGFSFRREGPLDMRMDPSQKLDAATWLQRSTEKEIETALHEYGEERFARTIAKAIVQERKKNPLHTTTQLAQLIESCYPQPEQGKHAATRSFQAIRIVVNNEFEELKKALEAVLNILAIGGRLCVISFHSLEDDIVKRFIQKWVSGKDEEALSSFPHFSMPKRLRKIGKLIRPSNAEIKKNIRARSARMRIAEKIA
jgi:16S rRNA (cytosine1402-N4)-methyltransferase